ncbi:hypothetical protein [Streptomyces microflavus]|uniref:hypothetical protein n=1 Tax=Streptomyces microflavus TaxID=1919 RepID=UPI00386BFC27|nr:hypothetical protein OG721_00030 [Streptomyces microflavus]WST19585.1 hypothetical protein OG721_39070 [Streptomyces microflavus]
MQTNTPGGADAAGGKSDEILAERAIRDAEKQSLVGVEEARSENGVRLAAPNSISRLRRLALAGVICLIAVTALVAGAVVGVLFVVEKASHLRLPWPPVGTSTLTLVGASLLGAASWRVGQSVLRRRAARVSAANLPESRTEHDPSPVEAP